MIGYACEGMTWGPRQRAASVSDLIDLAVGQGPKAPVLNGVPWRSVRWCEGRPLSGLSVVIGDPAVAVLADRGATVIAVRIDGQNCVPDCMARREPDAWWDAETNPLHPWAGMTLPSRGEVRARWSVDRPQIVCLSPSWSPLLLTRVAEQGAHRGVQVRTITDPTDLIGADLAVVSAGWGSVAEVKACGVPYLAVDLGKRDHPVRANAKPRDVVALVLQMRRGADLPDDLRPVMKDTRREFRDFVQSCI